MPMSDPAPKQQRGKLQCRAMMARLRPSGEKAWHTGSVPRSQCEYVDPGPGRTICGLRPFAPLTAHKIQYLCIPVAQDTSMCVQKPGRHGFEGHKSNDTDTLLNVELGDT